MVIESKRTKLKEKYRGMKDFVFPCINTHETYALLVLPDDIVQITKVKKDDSSLSWNSSYNPALGFNN